MTKDKATILEVGLLKKVKENLEKNIPARALEYNEDELLCTLNGAFVAPVRR